MNYAGTRYVAHIDILGMASIVEKDHKEAWELLSSLVVALRDASSKSIGIDFMSNEINVPDYVESVSFSDTVVLYTSDDSDESLLAIMFAVLQIMASTLHYRVPVRIGLAHGIFYADPALSRYAGPALVSAYRIGEASQWIGIVLDEQTAASLKKHPLTVSPSQIVDTYAVPIKGTSKEQPILNWVITVLRNVSRPPPYSVEEFYGVFAPTYGPFEDLTPDAQVKYRNTIDFINEMYRRHTEG